MLNERLKSLYLHPRPENVIFSGFETKVGIIVDSSPPEGRKLECYTLKILRPIDHVSGSVLFDLFFLKN